MNPSSPRYACVTLDYELDYGGRVSRFETLLDRRGHRRLREVLDERGAPLSAFCQTSVFEDHPASLEVLQTLATEVHSHSHSHAAQGFDSERELSTSLGILEQRFSQDHYGYRAPFGRLYEGDIELCGRLGYRFDASLFPSFRPGKFNNLRAPVEPFRWPSGLLELPFSVVPIARAILGISYMKLFGPSLIRFLTGVFDLPRVVVFYGHMHDFFPTDATQEFSPLLRAAFSRNGSRGLEITDAWLGHLAHQGYTFVTMNQLADLMDAEGVPEGDAQGLRA